MSNSPWGIGIITEIRSSSGQLQFSHGRREADLLSFISSQATQRKYPLEGFPGGEVVKGLPANAGDMGLSHGPGRSHMPRSN